MSLETKLQYLKYSLALFMALSGLLAVKALLEVATFTPRFVTDLLSIILIAALAYRLFREKHGKWAYWILYLYTSFRAILGIVALIGLVYTTSTMTSAEYTALSGMVGNIALVAGEGAMMTLLLTIIATLLARSDVRKYFLN